MRDDDSGPDTNRAQQTEITRRRQTGWTISPGVHWDNGDLSVEGQEPDGGAFYGRITTGGELVIEVDEADLAEARARRAFAGEDR